MSYMYVVLPFCFVCAFFVRSTCAGGETQRDIVVAMSSWIECVGGTLRPISARGKSTLWELCEAADDTLRRATDCRHPSK